MKRISFVVLLLASMAAAQDQPAQAAASTQKQEQFTSNLVERPIAPTFSDVNCSGFVTRQALPMTNLVAGAERTPQATRFGQRDTIFLKGGEYSVGQQFRLVRRVKDPNNNEIVRRQRKTLRDTGDLWTDLGIVRVTDIDKGVAVVNVEFACEPIEVGDLAIPFEERPIVPFSRKPIEFKEWAVATTGETGRIVGARDFDYLIGTGRKVYVNIGSGKGLKAGDYLRVTRGYGNDEQAAVDRISEEVGNLEDAADRMPRAPKPSEADLPRHGIGEMLVLSVTPDTATAMVTVAREDIHIGDRVEVEASQR
ncbi:MAG TPA: hypothetical protein VEG32_09665 [Clostridia bacterium]|nr:hypothetical protein [Clostridia bacterium]